MGAPQDLNEPTVYAEALALAVLLERDKLAAWLAGGEAIENTPIGKWYYYFADRLREMAPRPEQGFVPRSGVAVAAPKIGRNEPCPCGSGKKYKVCHLDQGGTFTWKLGSPTPEIRSMAVASLIARLPLSRLEAVPLERCATLALTELSMAFYHKEQLNKAIDVLKLALDGERDDSHVLLDYWIARYAEWLVAADRVKEAEEFLMDEFDAKRGVEGWQVAQKLAALYIDQGDPTSAETWVETALEGEPDNPFNHYLQGLLFHSVDRWEEAVTAYEKANELSDRFRDVERTYMTELLDYAMNRARNQQPLDDENDELVDDEATTAPSE